MWLEFWGGMSRITHWNVPNYSEAGIWLSSRLECTQLLRDLNVAGIQGFNVPNYSEATQARPSLSQLLHLLLI